MKDYISENSEEKPTRRGSTIVGDTKDKNSEDFKNYELTWRRGSLSLPCYSVLRK